MRIQGALFTAAIAYVAFGQTQAEQNIERVFSFKNAESAQEIGEISTAVVGVVQIQDVSTDASRQTLTVRGSTAQVAAAEWLFNQLDRPATLLPQPEDTAVREYRVGASDDDRIRVFYVKYPQSMQEFQEVATVIRSVGEIRRLFTYNPAKAVVMRGTATQAAFAAWMVDQLNPGGQVATDGFLVGGKSDDVARVFRLSHPETVQGFQEIAVLVRSITEIRRVFTYNGPRLMTVRGTPAQIALAGWLFQELDKRATEQNVAKHEYNIPGSSDDVVRLFYLKNAGSAQRLQEIAVKVRAETKTPRVFLQHSQYAMALRGTGEQMAMAERMIQDLKAQ